MSRHPEPGALTALRDGQLGTEEAERIRGHLVECRACSEALEAARARGRRVPAALPPGPELDADTMTEARERTRARLRSRRAAGTGPAVADPSATGESPADAGVVSLEARRADPSTSRRSPRTGGGTWGLGSLSRAAGLLLLVAGGAAALPGSPVRSWLAGPEPTRESGAVEAVAPSTRQAAAPEDETGIRVRVGERPVVVSLTGVPAGSRLEVERGMAGELSVFAPEGSRFQSADGRVEVRAERGPVRVSLPPDVASARISVEGTVLLRAEAGELRPQVPVADRWDEGLALEVPR